MKFYKIYHYSRKQNLTVIDPAFFGTGILQPAFKRGALGIPKTYYFIDADQKLPNPDDRPVKYEIYLPCNWKIYDIDADPEKFYDKARAQLGIEGEKYLYDWLIAERVEKILIENGYKGRTHAGGIAIAIFEKLSTKKPQGTYTIYKYASKEIIEEKFSIYVVQTLYTLFFKAQKLASTIDISTSKPGNPLLL